MKPSPERIARVASLKQLLSVPMTGAERALHRSRVAAVRAQDELQRQKDALQREMDLQPGECP